MNTEENTYQFVAGWVVMIVVLVLINKSRIGHVIIYYSLLVILFFLLVTEYRQLGPLLANVQSIGQFNAAQGN